MAKFTVDTQLFRELGELLVGRESTALVELIKNAYDADSQIVVVDGSDLHDPEISKIEILDNGTGMTEEEFENGFLRIATRAKTEGEKRSLFFERRFTGEKGIGRLALHKLARYVEIDSFKWNGNSPTSPHFPINEQGVRARIDWDLVEAQQTLDQIENVNAVSLEKLNASGNQIEAGTKIVLTKLRKSWTETDISKFHDDVATLVPPKVLIKEIPSSVLSESLIFKTPQFRDIPSSISDNFEIELLGNLAYSESLHASEIESANWILEIECDGAARTVRYHIAPTRIQIEEYPDSEHRSFTDALPDNAPTISFQARILQKQYKVWAKRYQGIRVYMEGFRVLPYGEPTNDWLDLNKDYVSRGRGRFESLGKYYDRIVEADKNAALVIQPNAAYFGAVFICHQGAPQLQMLVNREGFLPGPAMEFIRDRVRVGIDVLVRLRYSATKPVKSVRRQEAKEQREAVKKSDLRELPSAWKIREELRDSRAAIADARAAVSSGDISAAEAAIERSKESISNAEESIHEVATEASMLRVLATIGTELAAFVHEINGLLEMAVGLDRHLNRILSIAELNRPTKSKLNDVYNIVRDLRQSLEYHAVFLVDITSVDARRRRSRQDINSRFTTASRLFRTAAENRGIVIDSRIDEELRSPPMFPAEITALFANLLSNAVKFSRENGRIEARGRQSDDGVHILVENEGAPVDLSIAEKWFEPFQSTTSKVDATLGQGMGLGLTIARSILDEYGAQIAFVKPSKGFDTAVEIVFPES